MHFPWLSFKNPAVTFHRGSEGRCLSGRNLVVLDHLGRRSNLVRRRLRLGDRLLGRQRHIIVRIGLAKEVGRRVCRVLVLNLVDVRLVGGLGLGLVDAVGFVPCALGFLRILEMGDLIGFLSSHAASDQLLHHVALDELMHREGVGRIERHAIDGEAGRKMAVDVQAVAGDIGAGGIGHVVRPVDDRVVDGRFGSGIRKHGVDMCFPGLGKH